MSIEGIKNLRPTTPLLQNYILIASIWIGAMIVCSIIRYLGGDFNNFRIFTGVFHHTMDQSPLYELYPTQYHDHNHYGILFSVVIAPFALMPYWLSVPLWSVANAALLFFAIKSLPVERWKHALIFWIAINELYTAACMHQFNIAVAAFIVLSFVMVEKRKDFWAACFIALGMMTKIYGIVGLAFFLFSHNKRTFIFSLIFWIAIFYVLPMCLAGSEFVNNSYLQWIVDLAAKNEENTFAALQNVSLPGMVRQLTMSTAYSDWLILIPGILLMALPLLWIKQYANRDFRLMYLAAILIFVVIFSTGSESSTYIIAMVGVGIWFVATHTLHKGLNLTLLLLALVVTSLSTTDLFPYELRKTYILQYALKALPCILIWLKACVEMLIVDFSTTKNASQLIK